MALTHMWRDAVRRWLWSTPMGRLAVTRSVQRQHNGNKGLLWGRLRVVASLEYFPRQSVSQCNASTLQYPPAAALEKCCAHTRPFGSGSSPARRFTRFGGPVPSCQTVSRSGVLRMNQPGTATPIRRARACLRATRHVKAVVYQCGSTVTGSISFACGT
jgi:hypothetical protein